MTGKTHWKGGGGGKRMEGNKRGATDKKNPIVKKQQPTKKKTNLIKSQLGQGTSGQLGQGSARSNPGRPQKNIPVDGAPPNST